MQCNLSVLVMECKVLSGRPERTVEEVFPNSDYTITNAFERFEQQGMQEPNQEPSIKPNAP